MERLKTRTPGQPRRAGFTLVELLVVIGIIALLIAVLLPALGKARSQARTAVCLSNQRQIGTAMYSYSATSKGWIPRDGMSGVRLGFFAPYLVPFMGGKAVEDVVAVNSDVAYAVNYLRPIKIFKCPSVPDGDYVLCYVVNSLDFPYQKRTGNYGELTNNGLAYSFAPITTCKRPATTAYTVEVNMSTLAANNLGSYNIFRPSDLPYRTPPDVNAPQPYLTGNRMISYNDRRHDGRTTIAFFDGHAEARRLTPGEMPLSLISPNAVP